MKNLSKPQLIEIYKADCLNDYGKNRLIDKFLKQEEIKKAEIKKRIIKGIKRYHRNKKRIK